MQKLLVTTEISCIFRVLGLDDSLFPYMNSAHYKIDETLRKSDLEMISNYNLRGSDIDKKKKAFQGLNDLASTAHVKTPSDLFKPSMYITTTEKIVHKRTTPKKRHYRRSVHNKIKIQTSYDVESYDYDKSLQEYYSEMLWEEQQNDTYHPSAVDQDLLYYIKKVASYDKESNTSSALTGLTELQRLVVDYRERYNSEELAARMWKIFRICFLVYLAVALPLWCTKGWCCCCFFCRICRPGRSIMKAKNYLVQNPPGMQKNRKGHTLYEPTQDERKAYLEFEHLIRII